MLKLNSSIIRESAVIDPDSGKAICIKLDPPLNSIGFRLRRGREVHTLSVLDAFMAAKQHTRDTRGQSLTLARPKSLDRVSVKDEIINVLRAKGKQNIAQILQQLKEKRIPMDRKQAGEWLETLKEMNKVKQDKFNYELVGK